MRRTADIIENPRTWRRVPESGAVYGVGIEAGTVLLEWRPAADDPARIEVFVHRAVYDRKRGWSLTLPRADFQLRLFNCIHDSWDPCIYPFGFPFHERPEDGAA
ncbi:hypothetical protein [Streptomonospora litoralis]|uniref:Uncharacterized protein n=1 Tax=Streptomonospora litoralis TaxID=2498135 RepID=A0A4P6PVG2_9ACTN|nr:hypothetical protein [Streptomonospora litoralis]QBI52063.1 hypothetical protein EKD16_01230 [Streptomonospora litoralis]